MSDDPASRRRKESDSSGSNRTAQRADAVVEEEPTESSSAPRYAWLVFATLVFAYFLSYFYRSTNAVIADDLVRDVGLTPGQLGLMTSVFFLSFAAAQVPLGWALDRFGARLVTSGLLLSAVLGSAVFGLGQGFGELAVGRGLIGLGMSGVLMGSLKAFSGWFPGRQFATVSGLFLGLGSLGALAATTPLALLNEAFGWRAVFALGAVLVLIAAALVAIFVKKAPGEQGNVAREGMSLSPAPVFASVTFWRIGLLGFAVTSSMFAFQGLWAGPYLTDRVGMDQLAAGNVLFLLGLGVSVGYVFLGWLADRTSLPGVIVAGSLGLILVQIALAFYPPETAHWSLAALFLAFGFSASTSVLFFANVRSAFPLEMTGRAVTAVNLLGIGGSFLVQWLLGVLIGLFPEAAGGGYPPVAYTTSFLLTALILVAALLYYLTAFRSRYP